MPRSCPLLRCAPVRGQASPARRLPLEPSSGTETNQPKEKTMTNKRNTETKSEPKMPIYHAYTVGDGKGRPEGFLDPHRLVLRPRPRLRAERSSSTPCRSTDASSFAHRRPTSRRPTCGS
ncbi:hypothetical protein MES5069_550246 [Mesorhizobium escarrei]|uniref:Uncharacterized protein n=1 Tax=Mesorhizobium escarrei TaxID=666018 RepID=A0ABM9ED97_9HYPH|nr:hypothetical protein MES5069_550246 [Mesorhizobium escarrei]